MRAPQRRRPLGRVIAPLPKTDYARLAERAAYVGSVEHKDGPSFAGHPRPRADASICDPALSDKRDLITSWLREAIRRRSVSATMDGEFPRYVWYCDQSVAYEARVTNRERGEYSGEYKGYPLDRDEWPEGIAARFAPASQPGGRLL